MIFSLKWMILPMANCAGEGDRTLCGTLRGALETALLVLVTRGMTPRELSKIDDRATAVALTQEALDSFDTRMLEQWASRGAMAISICAGEVRGRALAAALLSDYIVVQNDAVISASTGVTRQTEVCRPARHSFHPDALAALCWRLGHRAVRTLALEPFPIAAERALQLGIVDELVPPATDPLHWLNLWIGRRSLAALAAAARLIRTGRSEVGERIEFSRLFSTGEPQEGLRRFLAKQNLDFSSRTTVETI